MICPQCQGAQLASSFTPEGIRYNCLGCGCVFKDSPEAEFDNDALEPVAARPAPKAPPAVAQKTASPLSPKDILKIARARLRELNAEIKVLTARKQERDQIKRLLAAAKKTKTDGQANVRPLHRTHTGS